MGSYLLSLPPELISRVTTLLPRKDLFKFSILSSTARQFVIASLFRHVRLKGDMELACDVLNQAGENLKDAIKDIVIDMPWTLDDTTRTKRYTPPVPICVFQTLETLPNLSTLKFSDYTTRIRFCDLPLLLPIAQKTQLRHLYFETVDGSVASGPRVAGPADLETASIKWRVSDDPQDQNSSAAHLYEFLRPSLGTLSRLQIVHRDSREKTRSGTAQFLNFRQFGPPCVSVRNLKYTTYSRGPKALEAVAEMFTNLHTLGIIFERTHIGMCAVWTDEFLEPLSSLTDLTHLEIGVDLEISANDTLDEDHDLAWYRRCFLRRFAVSKDIMNVCPRLLRCEWTQLGIDSEGNNELHSFVIHEEDGRRIVKPVMQWWMARQWERQHGGLCPMTWLKKMLFGKSTRNLYREENQLTIRTNQTRA